VLERSEVGRDTSETELKSGGWCVRVPASVSDSTGQADASAGPYSRSTAARMSSASAWAPEESQRNYGCDGRNTPASGVM
jgi:hypothetical protein